MLRHIRKAALPLRYLRRGANAFRRDDRGNLAVIFALSLIPLLSAAGAAIDLNRAFIVQQRLQRALDAAGLAVGSAPNAPIAEMTATAQAYFDANYPEAELGVPGTLNVVPGDQRVTLSATAELPTSIMSIVGFDKLTVGSEIEVVRESKKLEVVMVLDNTGSMNYNDKIGALRDAAEDLVDIMFGDQENPELLRMAMVPFVTSVNIRASSFDMSWMDVNGQSEFHGENFDPNRGPTNHFTLFDGVGNTTWKGCVEMRPEPYDTLDTAPSTGNPDTLFVPYFWPDEPDSGWGYNNNYTNDDRGGSSERRQENSAKYDGSNMSIDETPSSTSGPNKSCGQPILPLTNSKSALIDDVRAMRAWNNSGTNIAEGLAWGWRVLSPGEPFTEGLPSSDPDVQKALILLTDGNNEVVGQSTHNESDYTSFGYVGTGRLGVTTTWQARNIIDDKVATLCDRVKDEGVRVYTITFQLNSSSLQDIFRACATEPQLYFDSPSNEELRRTFQAIAYDLSNLRLAR